MMDMSKKTLRSCENCREAKAKCVPSSVPDTKECQRCLKFNKLCVYREPQPRAKRSKQVHTRLTEVEKTLDDVRKMLQPYQQGSQGDKYVASTENSSTLGQSSKHGIPSRKKASVHVLPELCTTHEHRERDAIDKEILSEEEANQLLRIYLTLSQGFPFIYIDPEKSLDSLRNGRPFLLLAVLTVSSTKSRSLQVLLEKDLRETLASKLIIEGELSLDLLQGLMLYLSCYHHNFRPARQQIYQLTQLCGSMIVDLELHKPPETSPGFVLHPSKACMACKKDTAPPMTSEAEALRTFLGAYYLTTNISILLRKPNGMVYTPYLEECCTRLSQLSEVPTDTLLISYIRLTQIAEEIAALFGYCTTKIKLSWDLKHIQYKVEAFMEKVWAVRREIPREVREPPSLVSLLHFVTNLALEVTFHLDAKFGSKPTSAFIDPEEQWQLSSIKADMFRTLFDQLRDGLDWYISLQLQTLGNFNLINTSHITYHLFLYGRHTLSDYDGSDMEFPFQAQRMNSYFETLLDKYQELDYSQNQEPNRSIYWQMRDIIDACKKWTMRKIAQKFAGEKLDAAGMRPDFHIVNPWGVVDLETDQVEVLAHGYAVAAAVRS